MPKKGSDGDRHSENLRACVTAALASQVATRKHADELQRTIEQARQRIIASIGHPDKDLPTLLEMLATMHDEDKLTIGRLKEVAKENKDGIRKTDPND